MNARSLESERQNNEDGNERTAADKGTQKRKAATISATHSQAVAVGQ